MENTEETSKSLIKINSSTDIEAALNQLVNLNEQSIMHEPTCIICNSPHRSEVEKEWLSSNKDYAKVKALFCSKSNLKVSDDIIENHMSHHFNKGVRELQKTEYVNRIKRLSNIEMTTLDKINLCLSALIERLAGINSISPQSDLSYADVEKIKSAETSRLMGSFSTLIKLQATIMGEMKEEGELITLPRQPFINMFNKMLIEAKTDIEKVIIQKILKGLMELTNKKE